MQTLPQLPARNDRIQMRLPLEIRKQGVKVLRLELKCNTRFNLYSAVDEASHRNKKQRVEEVKGEDNTSVDADSTAS